MPPKDKYTDPELRDQVKQEVQDSDKGGAPGQWSARKAQMMASEYKKRGGGYTTDKDQKDESQKNLDNWGEEEWQTKEGSGNAKKEDGTEKRYLPKKAWEKMSEEEKEATDQKKQEESKQGKQFVSNTGKAKESRKEATKGGQGHQANGKKSNGKKDEGEEGDDNEMQEDDDAAKEDGDDTFEDDGEADDDQDGDVEQDGEGFDEDDEDDAIPEHLDAKEDEDEDEDDSKTGQKRKAEQSKGSSKKQKDSSGQGKQNGTVGSKHMDATEPGQRGSADRLPKEGQQVHWKALPGYVDGEVVEILIKGKNVDGKSVKASGDDPKIVLRSNKSGKICVHKPDACFYD